MSPHISIKGELVFSLFGFPVTNTVLTTIIVVIAFYFIARYYFAEINKKKRSLVFYALHGFVMMIQDLVKSVLGARSNFFFPLLGSFFFFILMMNWSGLFPGVGSLLIGVPNEEKVVHEEVQSDIIVESDHENVETAVESNIVTDEETSSHEYHKIPLLRGGTADLNTTLALALVTVFVTQIFGFKFLGAKIHLSKYFNFKDPMMLFLGPLELIQEFARIISFSFRLYGNIFAGEVLLTIIPFLLPAALSFIVSPIFFMEIFVGIVQALVFVMLSAVFISMATAEHH